LKLVDGRRIIAALMKESEDFTNDPVRDATRVLEYLLLLVLEDSFGIEERSGDGMLCVNIVVMRMEGSATFEIDGIIQISTSLSLV
jgi:hypothetical protein